MPAFSKSSLRNRESLHPDLKRVVDEAIKRADFSIICGHRDRFDQERAFLAGTSNARWPHSRHNTMPSEAMDLAPWPLDWKDIERFRALSRVILKVADELGVKLVWGGTFRKLRDMPHYELEK